MSVRLALVLLLASAASSPAAGQEVGRVEGRQATPGGYYLNALPGEPTTRVFVWGNVRLPGVYEVGRGFDLAAVFSLAGGPVDPARPGAPDVRDAEMEVRVYRGGTTDGEPAYRARLDQFLSSPASHPALRDGDVILAERVSDLRVYVWGAVRSPGLYDVGPGFDAAGVLSLAGGPALGTIRNNDVRTVDVRVLRPGVEAPLYEAPLAQFVREGTELTLVDGDVIEVETRDRTPWSFRDTATVIGAAAGVLTAVVLAIDRLGSN